MDPSPVRCLDSRRRLSREGKEWRQAVTRIEGPSSDTMRPGSAGPGPPGPGLPDAARARDGLSRGPPGGPLRRVGRPSLLLQSRRLLTADGGAQEGILLPRSPGLLRWDPLPPDRGAGCGPSGKGGFSPSFVPTPLALPDGGLLPGRLPRLRRSVGPPPKRPSKFWRAPRGPPKVPAFRLAPERRRHIFVFGLWPRRHGESSGTS